MEFNYTCKELKTHTIRPGDPDFNIMGKFTISRRASIELSNHCPPGYRDIIMQAIDRGWITPVATITDRERVFMGLSK